MERQRELPGAPAMGIGTDNPIPQSGLPAYIADQVQLNTSFQSTESTESAESFRTQVPLPFYENSGYYEPTDLAPWATPQLIQDGTMPGLPAQQQYQSEQLNLHGQQLALNPASSPYIPTGMTPIANTGSFESARTSYNPSLAPSIHSQNSRNDSGASQTTYGSARLSDSIHNPNPVGQDFQMQSYNQQNSMGRSQNFQMQQYGQQYAQQPQGFNPYVGGNLDQYGNQQMQMPGEQMPAYGSMNSQGTFGAMGGQQGFQQSNLGHLNVSQAWGSIYDNPGPGYGSSNFSSQMQMSQSNIYAPNRGIIPRPASTGNSSGGSRSNYNKYRKKKAAGRAKKDAGNRSGGPIQLATSRPGSPAKSIVESVGSFKSLRSHIRSASPDRVSSQSHKPESVRSGLSVKSTHAVAPGGASGTPIAHPLSVDFASEPRKSRTLHLQTPRQSKGISHSNTDPAHITKWLKDNPTDLTPTNLKQLQKQQENIESSRALPPKLGPFVLPAIGPHALGTISEGDPFITPPHNTSYPGSSGSMAVTRPQPQTGYISRFQSLVDDSRFGKYQGQGMSTELRNLLAGGRNPHVDVALELCNLPFTEYMRNVEVPNYGVIRIKNIPYHVGRPEVLAFLGRNAKIVPEAHDEPIHIIMERVTSKTLDCFVEFINEDEAINAVNRFETNRTGGRGGRLGQRHVDIELSSPKELMSELFPKAKNVSWIGYRPMIIPHDPNDKYNSGFQGFVSREELVMLVKHVEAPQRSPFSKDCPQRPFECIISTILKYPWYMVEHITIEDRNDLFNAYKQLLSMLIERVQSDMDQLNLTTMLLKRVWKAGLRCPGFSPTMKDSIICLAGLDDRTAYEHNLAPYAVEWNCFGAIGPRPGAPRDLILWYIAVMRDATKADQPKLTLAQKAAQGPQAQKTGLFGDIKSFLNYGNQSVSTQTFSQIAGAEWACIELLLRRGLTPALEN